MKSTMTYRPTNGEQKAKAQMPGLMEFANFSLRDSYSIPAIDTDRSVVLLGGIHKKYTNAVDR